MSRIDVKKMLFDKDYIVNNPKMSLHAVTWDGEKIKKIHKAGRTELSNDVGNKVNLLIQNIAEFGAVSFGKKDGKDLTFECARDLGRTSKIYTNFASLFGDASFTHLKPEIANVLSDKQKVDIYKTFSSVHFMLSKIYDLSAVVNPTDGNYATIERYMKEITEASKLCRDIYESALSSEKFIERSKQESLSGADDFSEVKSALTNDIIMAFEKMGWNVSDAISVSKKDITIEKVEDAIEQKHANVTVGGESPFKKGDVATFIYNYIHLSEEQKRAFSIPRLFEVYGDTAKNIIETKYSYDEVVQQEHLDALNVDMQRDFGESGWKLSQLSGDGSLMRYSKEMMDIVHSADIAKDERKKYGNANVGSVRLAGVSGLETVKGDLQDENQIESLREELKVPFLDAIANETIDNGFKVKKDSGIVRNFIALLAKEQGKTIIEPDSGIAPSGSGKSRDEFLKDVYKEVYSYMIKHNENINEKIVSPEIFVDLQKDDMTLEKLPTPTPPTGAPTTAFKLDKGTLEKIINNAENKELLEAFLSIEENKDYVKNHESLVLDGLDDTAKAELKKEITDEKWPLYCAAAGLITDASKKKENAGKSIEEVWESAKDDIGKSCEKETKNALFNPTAEATDFSHLYRFGMFETLVPVLTEQLSHLSFEGDDNAKKLQKRNALNSLINQVIGASPNPLETEFYNAVADCVMNGSTVGNDFYDKLYKEAREDILISRYNAYIKNLQSGLAKGEVDGKPLTDDIKSQTQAEIYAFKHASDREKLVEMAVRATKEPKGNPAIKDVKDRQDILDEYNTSLKTKDPLKTSSLGDKLEFDAQGLAKKLKPFNVKAGQKYLQGLIDAIKKVKIIEQTATDTKGKDAPGKEGTPESPVAGDNENGGTGSGNSGNGSTNPNYSPEELKEKAAFYIMGHALDQSLNDMIRAGGLTEEDKNRLLSEQQDMKNLFNLLAFGEDKDKKFTFNNGKNAIQCGKIGYIQQIIYSKATDPNFKMNADELALVLADGQDVAIGARQERETDDMYIARIKANPTIASIIRSLDSISSEVAYALVGITSTKDGKDGHFAGKIDEKIMEALKDAKTPDEIKKALDSLNTTSLDMSTHKITEGPIAKIIRDSQLDFAVAKSREELRERIKDYAKKNIIDFSADKQTQKRQVQQFLNSEKVNEVQGMIYDTTLESNATARKEILDRVANELYSEIDNGLIANNGQTDISIHLAKNITPVVPVVPTVPTTPNYDAIVDKLIENKFDLSVLSLPNADTLKQQKRVKLRNEFSINANQYQGLLPESLTEDILNIIIDKFEEKTRAQQDNKTSIIIEGEAREILKGNVEILKDNGQLEYTESGRELIINVINSTSPELAEKLAKISLEDFVKLIKELESEIIKENPERTAAEKPKDYSAYQQIVEELAKNGFKLDPNDNDYVGQVKAKLQELAKVNELFNRQFTNDEIQGIVEAYSEYQRNHPAENVNKVQVVLDALKENGFEVDFAMGMPQKQIGEELKNPKYDKIRDVIKSLTEEEAKTITSEWIELYAKQGNVDMSY